MVRIQNIYLKISYTELSVTIDKIKNHFKFHQDSLIFKESNGYGFGVILFKKDKFNIRSEKYIRDNFRIGYQLPELTPSSNKEAKNIIEGVDNNKIYVHSSGMFLEIYNDYMKYIADNEYRNKFEDDLKRAKDKIKNLKSKLKKKTEIIINVYTYYPVDSSSKFNLSNISLLENIVKDEIEHMIEHSPH